MVLLRIQVEQKRAKFLKLLRHREGVSSVFPNYASAIAFAAVVGFKHQRRLPVEQVSRGDPDPIPQDQFGEKLRLFELLAVLETQDANVLAEQEEAMNQRALIFQEYANGGLEILQERLQGSENKLNQLILLIQLERQDTILDGGTLDFLSHS